MPAAPPEPSPAPARVGSGAAARVTRTQQPGPLLRPGPAERDRLVEIRDNLIARTAEARRKGWLGEVEGLQISLEATRQKLDHVDQIAKHRRSVPLGIPSFSDTAGRTLTGPATLK